MPRITPFYKRADVTYKFAHFNSAIDSGNLTVAKLALKDMKDLYIKMADGTVNTDSFQYTRSRIDIMNRSYLRAMAEKFDSNRK